MWPDFGKLVLNVTFNNSNIYDQIEEKGHPNNFAVVTICSSNLELPKNCMEYFESSFTPSLMDTLNCVILRISMWHWDWFSKIGSQIIYMLLAWYLKAHNIQCYIITDWCLKSIPAQCKFHIHIDIYYTEHTYTITFLILKSSVIVCLIA